eukprot:5229337-Pyramimonas_sp.AAC.2
MAHTCWKTAGAAGETAGASVASASPSDRGPQVHRGGSSGLTGHRKYIEVNGKHRKYIEVDGKWVDLDRPDREQFPDFDKAIPGMYSRVVRPIGPSSEYTRASC